MKIKILLVILMIFIGISPSFAQTTPSAVITGNAVGIIGPGGTLYPVSLSAQLVGCGPEVPLVPGGSIVTNFYKVAAPPPTYDASITAYGNDIITCGTQNYTTYAVTWLINNQPAAPTATYRVIQGGTCNISDGSCKPIGFVPPVITKAAGLFCAVGQQLMGFNADYTPNCVAFTSSALPTFKTNGVTNSDQTVLNLIATGGITAIATGGNITLSGSTLVAKTPTATQSITQPVNTDLTVNTSGTGEFQYNGNEVATIDQIPSVAGLIQSASSITQNITQGINTNFNVNTSGTGVFNYNGSPVANMATFSAPPVIGSVTPNAATFSKACNKASVIDAKSCFGAKADLNLIVSHNCSMTVGANILTCSAGKFALIDVGKEIFVSFAGIAGNTLHTTITGFTDTNHLTTSANASSSTTTADVIWASDDTTAIQNAFNAAVAQGNALYLGAGGYLHHGLNWTNNIIKIYGDGYGATSLWAFDVTNPGKINPSAQAGVDISGSDHNTIEDIFFYGGYLNFTDMAPGVNVMMARTTSAISLVHRFNGVGFNTSGQYNTFLLGFEQTSFIDCEWISNSVNPGASNLFLSSNNTPALISPYVTVAAPGTSMTKVSVMGARSAMQIISGFGSVIFDQGSFQQYTMAFRDIFAFLGNGSSLFRSDSTGALKHIQLDSVYAEGQTCQTCKMILIPSAPVWDWDLRNVEIYLNGVGFLGSPFTFNQFLDSRALIDATGQASGTAPTFNSGSCLGSILQLGQVQPTFNCTNAAYVSSVLGATLMQADVFGAATAYKFQGNTGITANVTAGSCVLHYQGGIVTSTTGTC